ncbi:MAG: phosphohexomutase domain-containing protein, partial [Candidatus Helarchaeales archaeon]
MRSITFGTDGWRARMDEAFTISNVAIVAQAIANYLKKENKYKRGLAIGHDTRRNSVLFAEEIARVICANEIKCYLVPEDVPTPVLTFSILEWNLDGAVMLTASHNPPEYNGLKFIPDYASPAMPDVTDSITREIQDLDDESTILKMDLEEARKKRLLFTRSPKEAYIKHVLNLLNRPLLE